MTQKPSILFLDFETTGLDPKRHAILQAAWILEFDGEVVAERVYDVLPDDQADICLAALDTNSFTLERMRKGKPIAYVLTALKADLLANVRGSKVARICGHNIQFDITFLMEACYKLRENLQSVLDIKKLLDTRSILCWFDYLGALNLPEYKLESVCHHYGIPIKAHDALEDVRACRKILHLLQP